MLFFDLQFYKKLILHNFYTIIDFQANPIHKNVPCTLFDGAIWMRHKKVMLKKSVTD